MPRLGVCDVRVGMPLLLTPWFSPHTLDALEGGSVAGVGEGNRVTCLDGSLAGEGEPAAVGSPPSGPRELPRGDREPRGGREIEVSQRM